MGAVRNLTSLPVTVLVGCGAQTALAAERSVITLVRMVDFPATVEVDGQKFAIQAPVPSPDGSTFQVLDPAGESLGAIEIGRDGKRRQSRDPTIERVASEAIRRGILLQR